MKKITGPGKSFQWEKVLDGKPDVLSWIPVTHLVWSENQCPQVVYECPQVVYDLHKYTSPAPKIYEVKKKKKLPGNKQSRVFRYNVTVAVAIML